MSWLSVLVSFFGGIGFGSVLTAIIQHWLSRRAKVDDLLIEGRQEAFRGIFEALEDLEVQWSEKGVKRVGFWISRIELLASRDTVEAAHAWRDTEPGTKLRQQATERMIEAMRKDLKLPQ